MTIINNIEIDNINYMNNDIKLAILNNEPIENKLHVIIVISNPYQYAQRYILAKEFIKRFEEQDNDNTILYIVELTYNTQKFHITDPTNKRHLQIKTNTPPLWHKENMINMGVKYLLPNNWKAFAWVDADIEFDSASWALDTLKILNGCRDIVQLFSHAIDMDINEDAMSIFSSFGFQYSKKRLYTKIGINKIWHPGFAWACTRKAYEKMGGLYDKSILGSGDHNMALSLINKGNISVNNLVHPDYLQSVLEFQNNITHLRLGYVPGVIRHHFHGSKKNRKYTERWQILIKHNFSPKKHLTYLPNGLITPSKSCPAQLLHDIMQYFADRNEDEGVQEALLQKMTLNKK